MITVPSTFRAMLRGSHERRVAGLPACRSSWSVVLL